MRILRPLLLLLPLLGLLGCGSGRPKSELERGQQAVTAALDNWKNGEPAAKLKSLADPIDFTEELRATHKLLDYSVVKTDGTDPQVIRYTVMLKLKDRKGKATDREAVYSVALRSPIAVARDPYY